MNCEHLEQQLAELPLYGYFFLKTGELTFTDRVRWICQHECQMYGKTWACPPAVGTVESCRSKCLAYPNVLLICTVTEVDDISDISATLATREEHEAVTRQVEAMVRAEGQEIYTLSTDGILLTQTAQECGVPFQYGDNVVTWFSMIFYRPQKVVPEM